MVPLATAADGGGSIRIPAANTGLIGFKGTLGRIPQQENAMFGTTPWILCVHVGPVARTWADTAAYMDAASGFHPLDMHSIPAPSIPYSSLSSGPSKRLKIVYTPSLTPVIDSRIQSHITNTLSIIRRLGHTVEERNLEIPSVAAAWGLLMGSQLFATVREKIVDTYGTDGLSKIERGIVQSWEAIPKIVDLEQQGNLMRMVFACNAFFAQHIFPTDGSGYDLFLTPAMPMEPIPVNGKQPKKVDGKDVDAGGLYGAMFPFNFLGMPAGVVRCAAPGGVEDWKTCASSLQVGLLGCFIGSVNRLLTLALAKKIVAAKHKDNIVLALMKEYIDAVPGLLDTWPKVEEIEAEAKKLGILGGGARM
jgi:Asp-tRNA(Asn)/Glu-tRNA(Gln) amidotransferase A subunit family amidase